MQPTKLLLVSCTIIYSSLITRFANAQQFYFPGTVYSDSAKLAKAMPVLSAGIMNYLASGAVKDKGKYFEALFTNQLITGKYEESYNSIDSLRTKLVSSGTFDVSSRPGLFYIYELYNMIKLIELEDSTSTEESLQIMLPYLDGFDEKAFNHAVQPFNLQPSDIKEEWQQHLNKLEMKQIDSLSAAEALAFSQAYARFIVYTALATKGKPLIQILNNANFLVQDSMMITMRDGANLAAIIVRSKTASTPQPVVMQSSIYPMSGVNKAKSIVAHGYTAVILYTRGKYVSNEIIEPWEHDADDTYDAIDWISKQPWCNGKIGMYGGSYLGFSQWAATKNLHPALKTIVPQVAAAPGIDFPMINSINSTYSLRWLRYATDTRSIDPVKFNNLKYWDSAFNNWYKSGNSFRSLDSLEGKSNTVFQRWLDHPAYDSYWQKMIPYKEDFKKINIPVLTITGYFDGDQLGALYYYREHYTWNKNADHYLLIGPYDHSGAQNTPSSKVAGYTIDPIAKVDITGLVFEWFDYVLKNGTKPTLLADKVNYEIMGANQWKHAASLEAMSNKKLQFYLSDKKEGQFYELGNRASNTFLRQEIDFTTRKTTKIADTHSMLLDSLRAGNDLIFISETLQEEMVISGALTADLFAIINKKDMDISISLVQQQPDGKYITISGTLQRASYAKDRSKRQLLQPGKKELIPIHHTFVTSKLISKGSRLLIRIGIHKSPYAQINYGTGKDVSNETIADGKEPLKIQWFSNSVITIPVQTPLP